MDLRAPGVLATRTDDLDRPVSGAATPPGTAGTGTGGSGSVRRRPWVLLWAGVTAWFLAISLPRYIGLDRSRSGVELNPRFPLHYPLLIAHVTFGTVALLTVCLQVWPWLRERHPAVHRWSGRVYVFVGVLPTALLALVIMPFSDAPVGHVVSATLWLATTITGYRMARQGRLAEHRRWMTYSFALAIAIMWGRVMLQVLPHVPGVNLDDPRTLALVLEAASWIGVLINLLAAQWWLERTARSVTASPAPLGGRARVEE
jgi:uncharacterized membrane protein